MAIREQGYRHWEGTYTSHAWRWWTITKACLRSTVYTKGRLFMLLLLAAVAWIMPFFLGFFYFFDEFSRLQPPDASLRLNLWEMLNFWQWMWGVIFGAVIGSRLISNDLRSEALYIYLAKPLRRIDYIIGKFLTCFLWVLVVTLLPALWVYLAATGSANKQLPFQEPWEILGELVLVYFVFALLSAACAVTISSMTKRWTIALIAWIGAVFLLAPIAEITVEVTKDPEWFLISPRHDMVIFAEHVWEVDESREEENVFRPEYDFPSWQGSLWVILGLIAVATTTFALRILRLEVAE